MLVFSGNFVDLFSLPQSGAGLVKAEGHAVLDALHMGIEYPAVITDSCPRSGFAAAGDAADLRAIFFKIRPDIDLFQHRLMNNRFIRQRQFKIDGKALICHLLIFTGTADMDVRIAFSPVCRKGVKDPLRTFCDHVEIAV